MKRNIKRRERAEAETDCEVGRSRRDRKGR